MKAASKATSIESCDDLMEVLTRQLSEDIIDGNFDVGYLEGSTVLRLRNGHDLEVWSCIRKSGSKSKVMLWCDGLAMIKESRKHSRSDEKPEGNTRKKQPDREQKVQQLVDTLKGTHESNYSTMQFRIWAEMIASGMVSSMDEPPNTAVCSCWQRYPIPKEGECASS